MNAQKSKPLAVSLLLMVFVIPVLVGGCVNRGGEHLREKHPGYKVKTKGNYEVAAYCFSREYRNAGLKPKSDWDPGSVANLTPPVVEIAPDKDYGEFFIYPVVNVIFRNAPDGSSVAEIHSSQSFSFSPITTRLLEATKKCQLEEPTED